MYIVIYGEYCLEYRAMVFKTEELTEEVWKLLSKLAMQIHSTIFNSYEDAYEASEIIVKEYCDLCK